MARPDIEDLKLQLSTLEGVDRIHLHLIIASHIGNQNYNEAREHVAQAMEIAEQVQDRSLLSDCYTVAGIVEYQVKHLEDAIELMRKAAEYGKGLFDYGHELAARQKLGLYLMQLNRMDEAHEHMMYCMLLYRQIQEVMIKWEGQHNVSQYLLQVDPHAAAELALENRAMLLRIGTHTHFINDLNVLARAAEKIGDLDKAIAYYQEAIRIKEELKDNSQLLHVARNAAHLYWRKGEKEIAKSFYQREVAFQRNISEPLSQQSAKLADALTYYRAGLTDEAIALAEEANHVARKENNLRLLGQAQFQMGSLLAEMNQHADAIEWLEKSLDTKGEDMPTDDRIATLNLLHVCYNEAKNFEAAYKALAAMNAHQANLLSNEKERQIRYLNLKYDTDKRETELRELKIKQQQTELERSDSELKAIKAQMNPHFIFNALNSIQEMFFIGDKRLANEHLGQFSQLTRQILKASGKQFIALAEEMEMLERYLQLEALRFEKDFSFSISVNDENVADDVLLPPMLIQPYVENAIRHGLLHKQGEKKVQVNFHFDEASRLLICTVSDNGIGREAAAKINAHRSKLHESFSTSANAKRLELLNQNRDEKIGVVYEDLSTGTKVTIQIPVQYD